MAGRVGADPREFAPQLGRRVDAGKTVTQVQRNQCGMSDFIKTTFCLALAGFPEAFASSFSGIEQELAREQEEDLLSYLRPPRPSPRLYN